MPQRTILNGLRLFAISTAISAVGILTVAAPAYANAACTQYGFPGDFGITQSNHTNVTFKSTGQTARGNANAFDLHFNRPGFTGQVTGQITGRTVNFTIQWDNGLRGVYNGTVGNDDKAHGTGFEAEFASATAKWDSVIPLKCLK
jgi:hypothetical protein